MPRIRYSHPDQLTLNFGFAPNSKDNFFFAAIPDEEAVARMSEIAQLLRAKHHLSGLVRPRGVLHASLRGVGGDDPQFIARVKKAAASIKMQPFTVHFNRATSFHAIDKKPVVLLGDIEGVDGFLRLRDALNDAMRAAGFSSESGSFTPHITVLYDEAEMPVEFIDTISWTVRDFHLIHSVVRETCHIRLGSWPLRR